jgi:hypothetical protein
VRPCQHRSKRALLPYLLSQREKGHLSGLGQPGWSPTRNTSDRLSGESAGSLQETDSGWPRSQHRRGVAALPTRGPLCSSRPGSACATAPAWASPHSPPPRVPTAGLCHQRCRLAPLCTQSWSVPAGSGKVGQAAGPGGGTRCHACQASDGGFG